MKAKNKKKRLEARIKDWDSIRQTDMASPKVKLVNKCGFTRPGSLNK